MIELWTKPKNESRAHRDAKDRLLAMHTANGGRWTILYEGANSYARLALDLRHCEPVVECSDHGERIYDADAHRERHGRYPAMIFDLGLVHKGRVVAAFEVVKNHGLTDEKRAKIRASGILVLAIKASCAELETTTDTVEAIEIVGNAKAIALLASPEAKAAAERETITQGANP